MTEGARVAETESTSSPGLGRDFHFYATGTAVSVVRYPARYMDTRGRVMWARVMGLL